ncbi:LpqB family beta-propeller domain-containing protein [Pseudonocardia sp. TRM90224]|uniref:LpqB family beta-propeller domain-containing protein n=1 Tax=Pseudonocardia sp. TRM90224 TaxID=2812678 RepID=UPI001E4997A9|nr:LpqB family beta-propeller domain-containing protein [Pseudonocardia sp. TRM90224]
MLIVASAAGCASVPESSPVEVIRRISDGEDAAPPPGPAADSNPLDLVRDFVTASGSSTDNHGVARRFLTSEAQSWDDTASVTVLDGQIDTIPAPSGPPGVRDPDATPTITIRIRGNQIGRVTSSGSFEPARQDFVADVDVVQRDGQWRISALPAGVVIPLLIFKDNYRAVRTWFVDPTRRLVVPDIRYIPAVPARAQAARVMDLLLAGPSGALQGAATTQFAQGVRLRSNVAVGPDNAHVVDLTRTGELNDDERRLLAAQVVLSLAEVNVARVRLLVDGEPLVPGKTEWTRDDVAALSAETQPRADVPALVVTGGKVGDLNAPVPGSVLPGAFGNGSYFAESAASSLDGQRLAVVISTPPSRTLLLGGIAEGGRIEPVALNPSTMSRPTWTPTGNEVWTVLDSSTVARVVLDNAGVVRTDRVNADELTTHGRITDMRLSRDGMRVAAVVAGRLYSAAVARSVDGEVAIRNVRVLPPALGTVVGVDWRASDSLVAITGGPEAAVVQVAADGLQDTPVIRNNLTPPFKAIAAVPNRSMLVTDDSGIWSFSGGEQDAWRQVLGNARDAVPLYPG